MLKVVTWAVSLSEDLNTIHRWMLSRSTATYWFFGIAGAVGLIFAAGLAMEWPTRVGPPAIWIVDGLVIVMFWAHHLRFASKQPGDD